MLNYCEIEDIISVSDTCHKLHKIGINPNCAYFMDIEHICVNKITNPLLDRWSQIKSLKYYVNSDDEWLGELFKLERPNRQPCTREERKSKITGFNRCWYKSLEKIDLFCWYQDFFIEWEPSFEKLKQVNFYGDTHRFPSCISEFFVSKDIKKLNLIYNNMHCYDNKTCCVFKAIVKSRKTLES